MPLNNLIILNKVAFTMSHDALRAHDVPHAHIKKDERETNTTRVEAHFFAYTSKPNTITAVC